MSHFKSQKHKINNNLLYLEVLLMMLVLN